MIVRQRLIDRVHVNVLPLVLLLLSACGASPPLAAPPAPPPAPVDDDPVAVTEPMPARPAATDRRLQLANGMTGYLVMAPEGSDAQVQLGVFGGALFGAPGLAELAADVLVRSTDPSQGQRSLIQEIGAMGGTVEVEVGLTATWFEIRVPHTELVRAMTALRRALESVTTSRNQIERMRGELVARRCAEIARNPLAAIARALLLGERSTAAYVNSLLDLDPSQVSTFQSRLYRPERCLLAVSAPEQLNRLAAAVQAPTATALASWLPPPAIPGNTEIMARSFESGLYWSEVGAGPGNVRVAIVLRLPDPTEQGAAEWLILHACLTLDGTGGRLERFQDEAGLGHLRWQARLEQTPDALALVMTTDATAAQAVDLWRVAQQARSSLLKSPPSASELQLACRRARLGAGLAMLDSGARLRLAAGLATRGLSLGGLHQRLDVLSQPGSWDFERAARDYLQTPAWMIAVGRGRPTDLPGMHAFDLLPAGIGPADRAPTATGKDPADQWLERAKQAVGGSDVVASLAGFTAEAHVVPEQAPCADDIITWRDDGSLLRRRTVLGETIETKIDGDQWSERFDGSTKSIDASEVALLRHEMRRHPLMLLAAHSRREVKFRAVAQRRVGDRELMVLEATARGFDRLRIHIDVESALIRVVEAWERLADDTLVHVQETWSDYRAEGRLRVPHHRATTWNDGQHGSETVYGRWTPARR